MSGRLLILLGFILEITAWGQSLKIDGQLLDSDRGERSGVFELTEKQSLLGGLPKYELSFSSNGQTLVFPPEFVSDLEGRLQSVPSENIWQVFSSLETLNLTTSSEEILHYRAPGEHRFKLEKAQAVTAPFYRAPLSPTVRNVQDGRVGIRAKMQILETKESIDGTFRIVKGPWGGKRAVFIADKGLGEPLPLSGDFANEFHDQLISFLRSKQDTILRLELEVSESLVHHYRAPSTIEYKLEGINPRFQMGGPVVQLRNPFPNKGCSLLSLLVQ